MLDNETLALAREVKDRLLFANHTMATAESCTGGLIAAALTSVAGSSAIFYGGFVTYANEAKTNMIGVPAELIAEHGAVSEAVARAMAIGCQQTANVDAAVSVTGIAGPGGGSDAKPIGLVHFGLAIPKGVLHRQQRFGDLGRDVIRQASVRVALEMILEVYAE